MEATFADRVLEGPTGVGVILFRLPVDFPAAGVFCGDALRGCGVLRVDGCGGNAGAPPNEKLKAAFLSSRGLPSRRRQYILMLGVSKAWSLTQHPAVAQAVVPACLQSCQCFVTCHGQLKSDGTLGSHCG